MLQHGLFVRLGEDGVVLAVLFQQVLGGIDLVGGLVEFGVYLLHKHLVLEALAPMLVGLLARLGPRGVLALYAVCLVRLEIPLCRMQKVRRELHALAKPAAVEVVDIVSETWIAGMNLVVKREFAFGKLVQVALKEHGVVEVVVRDKVGPRLLRNAVVELLLKYVVFRQHVAKAPGDLPVIVLRRDICRARS